MCACALVRVNVCVCVRVFNGVCLCVEMEVESMREGGREGV